MNQNKQIFELYIDYLVAWWSYTATTVYQSFRWGYYWWENYSVSFKLTVWIADLWKHINKYIRETQGMKRF